MIKYDLEKMLEEIRRDERGGKGADPQKKVMTQEEIRALARGRRRKTPDDKPPEPK